MSYNINLQHIIFRTAHSVPTIPEQSKRTMLAYINNVSKEMGVSIKRINAYRNHVHILAEVPVTILLAEYVRKIKVTSSAAFKGHEDFPSFQGWATGYGSFSVSYYEKEHIANYIRGQEEHHRYRTFAEELEELFGKETVGQDKYWKSNWID